MSQVLLNIINDLNVSNTKTGTLLVNYGGTGVTNLGSNQLLVGNGTGAVIQSSNLTWNNSTNTLSATNFVGSGAGLKALTASNISGTINVFQGGTGTTNLNSGQILVGNGTDPVIQNNNFVWDNTNKRLGIGLTNPKALLELYSSSHLEPRIILSGQDFTQLGSSNSGIAFLCGVNLTNNRQLWICDSANLTKNSTNNAIRIIPMAPWTNGAVIDSITMNDAISRLTLNGSLIILPNGNVGISKTNPNTALDVNGTVTGTLFSGSGASLTSLTASNISGTINVNQGGTGTANLNSGQILIGNGTGAVIQNNNFTWNNTANCLGIGKTNPSTTLDVSGNILTNSQFLGTGTNISYSWLNDTTTGIGKPVPGTIGFYTNGNERFRIQSNGDANFDNNTLYVDSINNRIGIGTSTPSTTLHINGNTKVDGSLTVQNLTVNGTTTIVDTNTQTTEQLIITNDGTGPAVIINQLGNQPILQLQSNNTTVFQVLNEGLIGVGVTNPNAKVDISVNNNIGLKINQYNDNYNIIDLQSNSTSILTLNKNNMVINNKFTLDTSGNLIIKGNIYGKNTISKVGFSFTVKSLIDPITLTNVYYYNVNLSKYYTTNQTIKSNNIQVFRLTTFDISGNEIETDFIYISSYNGGIKKIIKNRIANGDSQIYGWSSNETNNTYLTYYSDSIKTLYCILEPIL
jgi:hypothetical protein